MLNRLTLQVNKARREKLRRQYELRRAFERDRDKLYRRCERRIARESERLQTREERELARFSETLQEICRETEERGQVRAP